MPLRRHHVSDRSREDGHLWHRRPAAGCHVFPRKQQQGGHMCGCSLTGYVFRLISAPAVSLSHYVLGRRLAAVQETKYKEIGLTVVVLWTGIDATKRCFCNRNALYTLALPRLASQLTRWSLFRPCCGLTGNPSQDSSSLRVYRGRRPHDDLWGVRVSLSFRATEPPACKAPVHVAGTCFVAPTFVSPVLRAIVIAVFC